MIYASIYRLVCDDPNIVYIGSTQQELTRRLGGHRSQSKQGDVYKCSSKQLFDAGNVRIELIEQKYFKDKYELEDRERYFILNTDYIVNKKSPPGKWALFSSAYCQRCGEHVMCSDVIEHKRWHPHLSMR